MRWFEDNAEGLLLMGLLAVMCLLMYILNVQTNARIDHIEDQLCAFRFYEDYSAGFNPDDISRWECANG